VVNETLAEMYSAGRVVTFFGQLDTLRRDTFLAKGAELPAIAGSVKELAGAAGNETSMTPQEIFTKGLEIAGALAADSPLGPALHLAAALSSLATSG
jgi:hypothetical protein